MKPLHALFLILICTSCPAFAQGTLVYDQQSAVDGFGSSGSRIGAFQPVGQSFTPTHDSVGFVQLQFVDYVFQNGIGSTVFVNLREGSITGNVLAATPQVFLHDGFSGVSTFFFSNNPNLVSGQMYYLEPVLASGDDAMIISGSYNYVGGTAYFAGQMDVNGRDLWFREGYVIPEPSTLLTGFLGMGLLLLSRHFRRPC